MTQNPPQHRGGAAADRGLGRFRPTAGGGQPFDRPTRTPRLLLRDRDEQSEGLDGAWWPRTDNLTTELHDLVAALTTRLGATARIAFDWNSLSRSQRAIDPPDGIEVTGPLPDQPPQVMYVFDPDGRRLRLLVIDPATDEDRADEQMRKAAGAIADHSEP
ncbi:hypothetical protein SAMN04244553_4790 [Nocardia amikacinitolerans]|uniref:Uncharacterized protein n=1 Tax=Nocardia amikacinitolerans TaxID=756689 RepID=A0A285LSC9_9NOCA|nr:DUF5994 family protein [Nocardia amikacinitolerans]MCP2280004.1 hypothetical protein [Nocardia amikacinitolerans]MCP2295726.1 hypothetical protein [Nocardia amikacinitolerans]SNY87832.1 hypothetical protein SAMN04244553_4790 [Nocardia amikacinitolerans]